MERLAIVLTLIFVTLGAANIASASEIRGEPDYQIIFSLNDGPAAKPRLLFGDSAASPLLDQQRCCKVCTVGQACGNTCISRQYQCNQPPGCACDGSLSQ